MFISIPQVYIEIYMYILMDNLILCYVPSHKNRAILLQIGMADHILKTSLAILKVTNCVSWASFDCLHKNWKQDGLANFHLGSLQEAIKETKLWNIENTIVFF